MKQIVSLFLLLLLLFTSTEICGAILRVKQSATGSGNGTTWANAFTTLQSALSAAVNGDEIWVAAGTYFPTTGTNRSISFNMKSGVSLYGGFLGFESNRNNRNWNANPTILSGNIGFPYSSDNTIDLVRASGVVDCVIDGFVLRDAYKEFTPGSGGSALTIVNGSNVIVNHCIIRNNFGISSGALVGLQSSLYLNNSLITENWINTGAIVGNVINSGSLYISSCTFTKNHMVAAYASCIGGHVNSVLSVEHTVVWDNDNPQPDMSGGTINNCIFQGYVGNQGDVILGYLLTTNPEFVSPENGNYFLKPHSIAVDIGSDVAMEENFDLAHNPRVQNGVLDIGCYESLLCSQPNDACSQAIPLVMNGPSILGSTKCAEETIGIQGDCQEVNTYSSWYSFMAPESGSIHCAVDHVTAFETLYGQSFNIRVGLYTGTCSDLDHVFCVNDVGANQSEDMWLNPLVPGQTYYLRVDAPSYQEGAFYIYVEDATSWCGGDLDNNGIVNISDLLIFNAGYGCTENCGVQDLNNDDQVNVADLLLFASSYGAECPQ